MKNKDTILENDKSNFNFKGNFIVNPEFEMKRNMFENKAVLSKNNSKSKIKPIDNEYNNDKCDKLGKSNGLKLDIPRLKNSNFNRCNENSVKDSNFKNCSNHNISNSNEMNKENENNKIKIDENEINKLDLALIESLQTINQLENELTEKSNKIISVEQILNQYKEDFKVKIQIENRIKDKLLEKIKVKDQIISVLKRIKKVKKRKSMENINRALRINKVSSNKRIISNFNFSIIPLIKKASVYKNCQNKLSNPNPICSNNQIKNNMNSSFYDNNQIRNTNVNSNTNTNNSSKKNFTLFFNKTSVKIHNKEKQNLKIKTNGESESTKIINLNDYRNKINNTEIKNSNYKSSSNINASFNKANLNSIKKFNNNTKIKVVVNKINLNSLFNQAQDRDKEKEENSIIKDINSTDNFNLNSVNVSNSNNDSDCNLNYNCLTERSQSKLDMFTIKESTEFNSKNKIIKNKDYNNKIETDNLSTNDSFIQNNYEKFNNFNTTKFQNRKTISYDLNNEVLFNFLLKKNNNTDEIPQHLKETNYLNDEKNFEANNNIKGKIQFLNYPNQNQNQNQDNSMYNTSRTYKKSKILNRYNDINNSGYLSNNSKKNRNSKDSNLDSSSSDILNTVLKDNENCKNGMSIKSCNTNHVFTNTTDKQDFYNNKGNRHKYNMSSLY